MSLEDINFEKDLCHDEIWVGYAFNPSEKRRRLLKLWHKIPKKGNDRGDLVMDLGNVKFFRPGNWSHKSPTSPGRPVLRPDEYDKWYFVLVKHKPTL